MVRRRSAPLDGLLSGRRACLRAGPRPATPATEEGDDDVPGDPWSGHRDPRSGRPADGPGRLRGRPQRGVPGLRAGGRAGRLCDRPCRLRHQQGGRGRGAPDARAAALDGRPDGAGAGHDGAGHERAGGGRRSRSRIGRLIRHAAVMKYLDEYRDPVLARRLMAEIHRITTRPWTLMEVCGGQTHTIVKQGIDEALPEGVRMIHGPGCPVCVTPLEQIDKALAIAARPDVIFTSYGDMLRVPGSSTDLLALKARGADVRIVYSPLDSIRIALANPERQVVFFAVGFETTAPANASATAVAF